MRDKVVSVLNRTLMPLIDFFYETPQKSVRRVLHELNGNVSKSCFHWILKFDLKLVYYKISLTLYAAFIKDIY